jgi:hypothetical protein
MADFYARRIIEAMRSGVSSRDVGHCFSSARPKIMREIYDALGETVETQAPGGMMFCGKYGEGKTHLLNTVIGMAHEKNMAVSIVQLSKETRLDALHALYPKIVQNTYLPGRVQPGFSSAFEDMTLNSPNAQAMFEYALTSLTSDKLYYVLKAYLGTSDDEEKFKLLADIEGDYIANDELKRVFRGIYSEKAAIKTPFGKTKHAMDYFAFISRLFLELGYGGWALLFDECELIGSFSKKARLKAYANIYSLLRAAQPKAIFSIFAFSASFLPEVIEKRNEHGNLEASELSPEDKSKAGEALNRINNAPQLIPLGKDEITHVLRRILNFHADAYSWDPEPCAGNVLSIADDHGAPLRSKIRKAIELLDQYYQYGDAKEVQVGALGETVFEENPVPLDDLLEIVSC